MKGKVASIIFSALVVGSAGFVVPQHALGATTTYEYTRVVRRTTTTGPRVSYTRRVVAERPVIVRRTRSVVVERPAVVERVYERPAVVERVYESPAVVEKVYTQPILIKHNRGIIPKIYGSIFGG